MSASIRPEKITGKYAVAYIRDFVRQTVGDDQVGLSFERIQVLHNTRPVEFWRVKGGFMDDHLDPFGLEEFHNSQDRALPEIVAACFHDKSINAEHLRPLHQDLVSKKVLVAGMVQPGSVS